MNQKRVFVYLFVVLFAIQAALLATPAKKEKKLRLDEQAGSFHVRDLTETGGSFEIYDLDTKDFRGEAAHYFGSELDLLIDDEEKNTEESIEPVSWKKKRLGRAILEMIPMLGSSQVNYWIKYTQWIEDWQFQLTWKDQKRRFFSLEAQKFDSNCFQTNWTHSLAGALYYNFARSNNLTWGESLLYNTLTSMYWEFIVEWREVVSVNDNILTSIGGFSIGEAMYQTSKYFLDRPGTVNKIVGTLFDPILAFNHWLNRRSRRIHPPVLFNHAHQFTLFLGYKSGTHSVLGEDYSNFHVGLDTEIINIPKYGKAGSYDLGYNKPMSSRLHFDISFGPEGMEEYRASTKVILMGKAKQELQDTGDGVEGFTLFWGAGSSFELFQERSIFHFDSCTEFYFSDEFVNIPTPTQFTDKFSTVHIIGPVFDVNFLTSKTQLRLTVEAYLDFSLVNAMALNDYTQNANLEGVKATLANYGYYYAFGFTTEANARFKYENIQLGAGLRYTYYNSVEGLDRFYDTISDDFNIEDSRFDYNVNLGYTIPGTNAELFVNYEEVKRTGWIRDVTSRQTDKRFFGQVRFHF